MITLNIIFLERQAVEIQFPTLTAAIEAIPALMKANGVYEIQIWPDFHHRLRFPQV